MSDETHDQNQGLETPDTAPSRGRVVGLALIMYALVACIGYIFIYQLGAAVDLTGGEPAAGRVKSSSRVGTETEPAPDRTWRCSGP